MIFLDREQISIAELKQLLEECGDVIELVDVDDHENLHFEIHTYGTYY